MFYLKSDVRSLLRAGASLVPIIVAMLGMAAAAPRSVLAQQPAPEPTQDTTRKPFQLKGVTVTATRTATDVFAAPAPVIVVDTAAIREKAPNTAADLFRELPGLDVTGVGTNQTRPSIRGQRGQRILLLENGLRLNNARRQQDFGELPALVDVAGIERIEVVRGPGSVLYGTDAIGGVVNVITTDVRPASAGDGLHGRLGYRYSTQGEQQRPTGSLDGRYGRFAFLLSGAYRNTDPYVAPKGSFGNVSLASDTLVYDTGVKDEYWSALAGYDLTSNQRVFAKAEHYRARDAGFGYVDPNVLGRNQPLIQILYPWQRVERYSVGYRTSALGSALADRVEVTGYALKNRRQLQLNIFVPFGPPGAGLDQRSTNFTDLLTFGGRAEAVKVVAGRHLLTYGLDYFHDRSENSDSSVTVLRGFGPPRPTVSTTPQVPNATFRNAGVFAQGDLRLHDRVSVTLGARAQDFEARTRSTPGLSSPPLRSSNRTVVGTGNVVYHVLSSVNVIGSIGRAFRAPNLVELFFDGPTPEGSGYQRSNTSLEPETSLNLDAGLRARRGPFSGEVFVFRNTIRNGIRIAATGDSVNRVPAFSNVNVDELRFTGVELLAGVALPMGVQLGGNYTRFTTKDVNNPDNPVGSSYASKVSAEVAYRHPRGRFWSAYALRRNGEYKDFVTGTSPIGTTLPAFTVHTLRAGIALAHRGGLRHSLGATVDNLTNELYAEAANASFFRPEPRRNLTVNYTVSF